jgi:hypothetical protein
MDGNDVSDVVPNRSIVTASVGPDSNHRRLVIAEGNFYGGDTGHCMDRISQIVDRQLRTPSVEPWQLSVSPALPGRARA